MRFNQITRDLKSGGTYLVPYKVYWLEIDCAEKLISYEKKELVLGETFYLTPDLVTIVRMFVTSFGLSVEDGG